MSLTLADQLSEAHETIRQLRALLVPPLVFPKEIGLPKMENQIAAFLMQRSPHVATYQNLTAILNQDRDDGGTSERTLQVRICWMRPKLAKINVEIISHWRIGYSMSRESADILRRLTCPSR